MYLVTAISKKGNRVFAKNHPTGKRDRLLVTGRRQFAHSFNSWHTACNIRDDMLKGFTQVTVTRA